MGRLTSAGLHWPFSFAYRGRLAIAVLEEGGGSSGGVASLGEQYRYKRDEFISAERRRRIEEDDMEVLQVLMMWYIMENSK